METLKKTMFLGAEEAKEEREADLMGPSVLPRDGNGFTEIEKGLDKNEEHERVLNSTKEGGGERQVTMKHRAKNRDGTAIVEGGRWEAGTGWRF